MEQLLSEFSKLAWGTPLLVLLIGGGLFFLIYSKGVPLKHIGHALHVLRGKFDNINEPGQISHFQALSTALAATVGMGNISGVAVAIATGGPGAIFWMWVSAILGTTTKFFTCSLSVMYRGKDAFGEIQGGPMYVIKEGLHKKWLPLAYVFSTAGMIGVLPVFQANQLTQIISENIQSYAEPSLLLKLIIACIICVVISLVIFGGIKRIGKITAKLVPAMVLLYFISVLVILIRFHEKIPSSFSLIFRDAFSGNAVLGGALGTLIITGIKRAAFSNEAGIGTAPMAHGAAKTKEPIREGLVAMLGPIIDTIIVCTLTALAIIITDVWQHNDLSGISLTLEAFSKGIPFAGNYILMISVAIFSLSTMFTFPYYGAKCYAFIFKKTSKKYYLVFYILTALIGSVVSLSSVINLIDGMYAIMAIPTMISALLLAPKVKCEMKAYFDKVAKTK